MEERVYLECACVREFFNRLKSLTFHVVTQPQM